MEGFKERTRRVIWTVAATATLVPLEGGVHVTPKKWDLSHDRLWRAKCRPQSKSRTPYCTHNLRAGWMPLSNGFRGLRVRPLWSRLPEYGNIRSTGIFLCFQLRTSDWICMYFWLNLNLSFSTCPHPSPDDPRYFCYTKNLCVCDRFHTLIRNIPCTPDNHASNNILCYCSLAFLSTSLG